MDPEISKIEPHFIAYFDVQGYKSGVQQDENLFLFYIQSMFFALHANMESVYSAMKTFIKGMEMENIPKGTGIIKYKIFSDNVALYFPITENNLINDYYLSLLIDSCCNLQCHFTRLGLKIRGGITKGNLYANNDFVYGSGLIRAVELETDVAKFSRIILDDEDIKISERNLMDRMGQFVALDEDDVYYLDYLSYYFYRYSDDAPNFPKDERETKKRSFLKRHYEMTISTPQEGLLEQKYKWLKNYHNKFCLKNGYDDYVVG